MGLISWPLGLAGRGLGAIGKGITGTRANATAVAADLIGMRGSDPLEARDPSFIRATLPNNEQIANVLFRPKVRGLEHIPAEGPVLLVGNHSGGTMIIDTFVFTFAFYRHFGPERRFHQLAHDLAVKFPGLSAMLRGYGTLPASHEYAGRALEAGAAVLVYPGGDYESFRPSWHSEEIEFGGRSGFVKLALSQDVPIVPVVSIGGQESGFFVTRGERLAKLLMLDRLLRIKVLPVIIGPPFGLSIMDLPPRLPLPSQVTIEVLPVIDLNERFGADPDEDEVYEEITSLMQDALDDLADERDLPLVGPVWSDRDGGEADEDRDDADEATSEGDDDAAEADDGREDADEGASEDGELEERPWRVPAHGVEAAAEEGTPAADSSATPADLEPPADEPAVPDAPTVPEVAAEASAAAEAADGGRPPPTASPQPDVEETAVSPAAPLPAASAGSTVAPDPPRAAPTVPTAPTAAPADPSIAAPADEEPSTLVAEFAEPGAEDGAGAELRVDEPWTGYASMKVAEISDRLPAESGEALLAVRLYEATHKNRSGVLRAVERELKRR